MGNKITLVSTIPDLPTRSLFFPGPIQPPTTVFSDPNIDPTEKRTTQRITGNRQYPTTTTSNRSPNIVFRGALIIWIAISVLLLSAFCITSAICLDKSKFYLFYNCYIISIVIIFKFSKIHFYWSIISLKDFIS